MYKHYQVHALDVVVQLNFGGMRNISWKFWYAYSSRINANRHKDSDAEDVHLIPLSNLLPAQFITNTNRTVRPLMTNFCAVANEL